MKNLVNLSGSICKNEVLTPLTSNILEHTFVCEASSPYANYYGQVPQKPKPNSLFLFTKKFYYIDQILSCAQYVEKCLLDEINIASAIIEHRGKQYPAIRIKHFPDYKNLPELQKCMLSHDVEFAEKLHINGETRACINKLFVLEKIEPGIYMDLVEDHKGYFMYDAKITTKQFSELMCLIRNNPSCILFDAVQGQILQDGNVLDMVRIFAEGLDIDTLKCLALAFRKRATRASTPVS